MLKAIIKLTFIFIMMLFISLNASAVDIRFVEEGKLTTVKQLDTLLDSKATAISGARQEFKLQCIDNEENQESFPFRLNPWIRVNGSAGLLIVDCSKGIQEYTFELSKEGFDTLFDANGELRVVSDIDFAGPDEENNQNFTSLTIDINYRTKARKARVRPDMTDEIVSAINRFI